MSPGKVTSRKRQGSCRIEPPKPKAVLPVGSNRIRSGPIWFDIIAFVVSAERIGSPPARIASRKRTISSALPFMQPPPPWKALRLKARDVPRLIGRAAGHEGLFEIIADAHRLRHGVGIGLNEARGVGDVEGCVSHAPTGR
jgi:hypothetical protein